MIDYEAMAREIARLKYWYISTIDKNAKAFWSAKYDGAARIIEIVTGYYPAVLHDKDAIFIVRIGDYKAVISF